MSHLEDLNLALIHASRRPQMDWAASISGAPGSDIPLAPPDLTQLQQLVAREQAIATAVDARYARLAGLAPGDYLRATRRQAADSFEERLLAASDRGYRLIIDALKDQFATAGTLSSLAVSAMRVMDDTKPPPGSARPPTAVHLPLTQCHSPPHKPH